MIKPTLILNETFASPDAGKVYGIHSATQGFLDAFISHSRPTDLHFRAGNATEEAAIATAVAKHGREITLHRSKFGNDISHCAMFYNIPQTNQFWLRQQISQNLYSICGINHSLTGDGAYTHLRDIFLAPTEAWDAIICTSRASQAVLSNYFEGWSITYQLEVVADFARHCICPSSLLASTPKRCRSTKPRASGAKR